VEVSEIDERATLAIVDAGKPLAGTFKLVYTNEERSMKGSEIEIPSYKQLKNIFIEFSPPSSKEVKVWLHRVTPEGNSEPLPVGIHIKDGDTDVEIQPDPKTGQVIKPLTGQVAVLEIALK